MERHNDPRCQGGLRYHLSMWPGQATWLLCASVKPAARVCSSSRSELRNRCYMWAELSWIIILPQVTVTCKTAEFKSSFLPWVSLSCYAAEHHCLSLSHRAVNFGPSWNEKYKILGHRLVPGIERKNVRLPPLMCKKYNFIFLQLNSISNKIPISWRKERGQFRTIPFSLKWNLLSDCFCGLQKGIGMSTVSESSCVYVLSSLKMSWFLSCDRWLLLHCSLFLNSWLLIIPRSLQIMNTHDSVAISNSLRLADAFHLCWASFRDKGKLLLFCCHWGRRENLGSLWVSRHKTPLLSGSQSHLNSYPGLKVRRMAKDTGLIFQEHTYSSMISLPLLFSSSLLIQENFIWAQVDLHSEALQSLEFLFLL